MASDMTLSNLELESLNGILDIPLNDGVEKENTARCGLGVGKKPVKRISSLQNIGTKDRKKQKKVAQAKKIESTKKTDTETKTENWEEWWQRVLPESTVQHVHFHFHYCNHSQ